MPQKKKNTKILLIAPRYNLTTKANYNYNFPLGLGYISAVLKKEGYDVDCFNMNHYSGTIEELINGLLDKKKYDFVCTGNNALGYAITKSIIDISRKHRSHPRIVLGGPIITSEPELIFEDLMPDFGVIGEGEKTIIELVDAVKDNKNLEKIKGIVFKKNGKSVFTEPREPISDINSLPWPDFEGFEFEKQFQNLYPNYTYIYNVFDYPRVYPILGSRGCPFQCTFCYHYSRYRKRTIDNIMEELKSAVKKHRINLILLYDECFSVNKERVYEFCKRIKELQKEISWELKWTVQLTVHNIDEEMLRIMKDAGCDSISYGFESFSSAVLKSMRKPITPQQIENAFNKTLKAGIGVQANFIFGDAAETKETAKETLDWWKKNCHGQVGLGFIQPYPGSEIYKHCVRKGIIKDKLDFIKNDLSRGNWFNMTDKMTDEEIKDLKKEILESTGGYCKFVMPISKKRMRENVYEFFVKCPFCGELNHYKNCFITTPWTYGFFMHCRKCKMRFFIVSWVQKVAYKHYSKIRALRDLQKKIINNIKKRRL